MAGASFVDKTKSGLSSILVIKKELGLKNVRLPKYTNAGQDLMLLIFAHEATDDS